MPFELVVDHGMTATGLEPFVGKRLPVLAAQRYEYQKALSDIAGWDIRSHDGDLRKRSARWVPSYIHMARPTGSTSWVPLSRPV